MTAYHHVHLEARAINVTYTGKLTCSTFLQFFDKFEHCLIRNPDFSELVDFSEVEEISISPSELICLYSLIHGIYLRSSTDKAISIVAKSRATRTRVEGFIKYLAEQSNGPRARLFDSFAEALDALEIPADKRYLFARQ